MRVAHIVGTATLLWIAGVSVVVEARDSRHITLTPIGRYNAGVGVPVNVRTEIAAYDPESERVFSINLEQTRVDVLDISTPTSPFLVAMFPLGGRPNSVAVHDGIVAVAIEGNLKTDSGKVQFFNINGALLNTLTVGALPDMLVFSRNGRWLLVANEGEPNSYGMPGSVDPEGSVSIIDMKAGVTNLTPFDVRTATFSDSIPTVNASSIRVYGPGATIAQDMEPEYITVSHDSKTAWVTLQENNAVAILDIRAGEFTKIVGLGFKDHSKPGNALDPSDQDTSVDNGTLKDGINIRGWPVLGMYEPDTIASYRVDGDTYLAMANEGDTRDWPGFNEEIRVGAGGYALDPDVFPNAAMLKQNQNLGRLTVTRATGANELDADPQFERIYVPGARSFSIRKANGTLLYDSGDDFEHITADLLPDLFNSQGTALDFDTRSDNKGPEPEGLVLGRISGRTYAFIGLERIGGVMVYDVSHPKKPEFVQYVNTAPLDRSPEGMLFIKKQDSPNRKPLLVVSHEVSNTVAIFEITQDRDEDDDDGKDDDRDEDDHRDRDRDDDQGRDDDDHRHKD